MSSESRACEFNVRATFWWRMDRSYRVYVRDHELILIRIGGQPVDWVAALNQLGVLGVWIGRKLNARREASLQAKSAEADRISPEVLVDQHPHSFRISTPEVVSSTFEPGSAISLHGPHAAAWHLSLRSGRSWRFQFDEAQEAVIALPLLRRVLGASLVTTAVWDDVEGRFVKSGAGRETIATPSVG